MLRDFEFTPAAGTPTVERLVKGSAPGVGMIPAAAITAGNQRRKQLTRQRALDITRIGGLKNSIADAKTALAAQSCAARSHCGAARPQESPGDGQGFCIVQ